jgi:hypothetical protein
MIVMGAADFLKLIVLCSWLGINRIIDNVTGGRVWLGSTVEHSIYNPKIEGSNPSTGTEDQSYKTFYGCNLRILVIS